MNATLMELVEEDLTSLHPDDQEEVAFIKEQSPATQERSQGLGRIQDVIATFKIFAG